MDIEKAGCILLNKDSKKICLVKRKDECGWEFPKGHLENGETLEECAIRETEEETLHLSHIIKEVILTEYTTMNDYINPNKKTNVRNHIFLAVDDGLTNRKINDKDKENCEWFDVEKIDENINNIFYFDNLKEAWKKAKKEILEFLNTNNE